MSGTGQRRIPNAAGSSSGIGTVKQVLSRSLAIIHVDGRDLRCLVVEGPWTPDLRTLSATHVHTDSDGDYADNGSHSHVLGRPLTPGDRVLVVYVGGRTHEPVMIDRFPAG